LERERRGNPFHPAAKAAYKPCAGKFFVAAKKQKILLTLEVTRLSPTHKKELIRKNN